MGGRWWRAVVGRLSLMQRGKAPLRFSRDPWLGGRAGGAPQGVGGAEGFGGAGHMGTPGGVRVGGVAPDRGGGWGSLLVACAAGAAGCAVVELGVEKGKEAAGVMADAWRQVQGDWLLLWVECADVAGLSASIKSDDSGSSLKNRESGGAGGAGGAGGTGGAGGGNESNGSNSSVVSHTSSDIAGGKSSDGAVGRKRVVVLGSGWGAVSFLKAIDAHGYDVTLISPRNFFLFTPLLPSVTTGVVEGRSIAEPIRRILLRHGSSAFFLEAECTAIDPASRTLSCRAPAALPPPLPMPTVAKVGGQEEGDRETTREGAKRKGGGASGGNSGGGAAAAPSCGDAVDGNVAAAGGNTRGGESGGAREVHGGAREVHGGAREVHFTVPYDMLVVAVGAVPNTFNVPGVQQHCHFLKSLDDAEAIRNTLIDRFEVACLPGIDADEQQRLLHVVVVGGGPTGVEVAAAVHDMIEGDLYRLYPALRGKASVSLLQSGDHILNMFDLRISEFAVRKFQRDGITVHTHARVTAVTPRALHVRETSSSRESSGSSDGSRSGLHSSSSSAKSSSGNSSGSTQGSREREVPYGVVVWATGITAHPLVVKLREQLGQHHKRALEVDEWMAVRGAEAGSMWALGDCAAIEHRPFTDEAVRIFRAFDTNGDGCLSPSETKAALRALQQRYPHAAALLRSRDRMAQLIQDALHADSKAGAPAAAPAAAPTDTPAGTGAPGNVGNEQACEGRGLSLEQFELLLRRVEGQMKTLPATAQVAAQQGQYVARCFNRLLDPALMPEGPPKLRGEGRHLLQPFRYVHLGQFAPLGSETTAAELPGDWVSIGRSTQWLWYSVYASKQVSARTRALVVFDWIKSTLFGRDSSRM
ncbi:unnamed protein product [Closterium sp. Yama58-4]|nr:unnamed protein product [Closterium sp. Yama58-4]